MRAEGLEPSRAFGSTDFRTVYGFRRPDPTEADQVCGLDYPFALPQILLGLGAARLVSTPSRIFWMSSGLGSGLPFQVSPSLGSSASPRFHREHSNLL